MIAVFDLDGTLCDNGAREHLARAASTAQPWEKDAAWDKFHEGIECDSAVMPVLKVLIALKFDGHDIEIWTARPDKYREQTNRWLKKHNVYVHPDQLLMRAENDFRPAPIVKLEWYLLGRDRKPGIVFEDHPETTRLLRLAGCVVAQVADRRKETL